MFDNLPTPCYMMDIKKLKSNLDILNHVEKRSGCHILLAQKAFSMYSLYPFIGEYLSGTTASGLYEARLGKEAMGKENHVYAPAFKEKDMDELVQICDHIVFNSLAQYEKHIAKCKNISVGLRINPEFSTQEGHEIYDPCQRGSRLGIRRCDLKEIPEGVEGLHFHTLCEQNADDCVRTFRAFEKGFGKDLYRMKWLNLGGGHHITREDYDVDALVNLILEIREKYHVEVYIEPGEAIALNAGYLITEVLDIVRNDLDILILDASAACHMPDVLEMPYHPRVVGSVEEASQKETKCQGGVESQNMYKYRLSSYTCLAGDVIGDYCFRKQIQIGDRLVFEDMAIYSMVKNNTFNGIPLPAIAILEEDGTQRVIKEFGYEDFKGRLS